MSGFFSGNLFFKLGLAGAVFYGIGCFFVLVEPEVKKGKKWPWYLHQFWFNALGAFIGWFLISYVYESYKNDVTKVGITQIIAIIIGFLGITGHLPYTALTRKIRT